MRSQLIRMLLLCWLLALPLLAQAQDSPELDATVTIPDAAFSMDYPGAWEVTEDELGLTLSSDDFAVLAILAYLPAEAYAETGSDLEAAHRSLEETGLVGGDPEAVRLGGQDAVRSAGDSDALGGYTVTVIVETPNEGAVFVIAVIFDEIEANEALLLAMHDTIRFDGDTTPPTEDDPTPPVTREVDIPELDSVLDVPELGFSLRYPSDWATAEPAEFIYVLGENESDLDVNDPAGLRATLIYVADYAGNPSELIAQYLGADFYYSTRMAELVDAGGSTLERLRGVTANNATYRTLTVIELPAGDAYALIVDGSVRDKFSIVALSDAMLASVEIRDERTETPDDPGTTTTYDLSETFEIPEAGFRMAYPDGWIEQENAGVYALAESDAAIESQTLDAPVILILYSPPADYASFGGTLEDFGSLLFGLIDARDYEDATVDGRDALLVRGPFVNTETQGYGVSVVFNSGDGGGLLVLGAVGEDRAEEMEALFAAMVATMQITDEGL